MNGIQTTGPPELRPYQKEALERMLEYDGQSALLVLAMGLGKTVIFTSFIRQMVLENDSVCLILSHQEELVRQPLKYMIDLPCGVEQGKNHANLMRNKVITASVQSLVNRLSHYNPREIDYIIIDEAHHAAAPTYRKILDYFECAKIFGFTATPRRGDGVGLDCVFEQIIYEKNIHWAIRNSFLCPIECRQSKLKYRLGEVQVREYDFDQKQLAEAMSGTALGVAEAYEKYARGQTVIFAASVHEVKEIVKEINRKNGKKIAAEITASTKNRQAILDAFELGALKVLVNYGVLTEGVDLPCIETVIMARPISRKNISLYAQCVGRGLRPYPGKKSCLIVDLVGITDVPICTAATLIGKEIPKEKKKEAEPEALDPEQDTPGIILDRIPETWLQEEKEVDVMEKEPDTDKHDVAWLKKPNGGYVLALPGMLYRISKPCENGRVFLYKNKKSSRSPVELQFVFDFVYQDLKKNHDKQKNLWDTKLRRTWATGKATNAQCELIKKLAPDFTDTSLLTKGDASMLINELLYLQKESE